MTAKQETTKNTLIMVLIALVGFLGGTNAAGWKASEDLQDHEKKDGHPVMLSRMDAVEMSLIEIKRNQDTYNQRQEKILIELIEINKKLK